MLSRQEVILGDNFLTKDTHTHTHTHKIIHVYGIRCERTVNISSLLRVYKEGSFLRRACTVQTLVELLFFRRNLSSIAIQLEIT